MTAQRQASQFYRRERRRSFVDTPRLFRTHRVGIGETLTEGLSAAAVVQPITFKTKVDLGVVTTFPATLVSSASGLALERINATTIRVTFGVTTVSEFTTPSSGLWTLIIAARPGDLQVRIFNQFGRITQGQADLGAGNVGVAGNPIVVENTPILVEALSIYTNQIPRQFS